MKHSRYTSLIDPDEILVDSVSALSGDHMEARMERPLGKFASVLFLLCVAVGFSYLLARAARLQILQGSDFLARAQENRFFTRPLSPPRGIIFDRFGTPLAENIPSLDAVFERDEFARARARLRFPNLRIVLMRFLDLAIFFPKRRVCFTRTI